MRKYKSVRILETRNTFNKHHQYPSLILQRKYLVVQGLESKTMITRQNDPLQIVPIQRQKVSSTLLKMERPAFHSISTLLSSQVLISKVLYLSLQNVQGSQQGRHHTT